MAMDPEAATAWVELVKSLGLGLTVSALVVIWALSRRMLVFGWYARAVEGERDAWRDTALEGKVVLRKLVEREERRL
jgi:hypothetical protein